MMAAMQGKPPKVVTVTTHKSQADNRFYRDVVAALGWKTSSAVTSPSEIHLWIYGPPYSNALETDSDIRSLKDGQVASR